jgi:phage terminase large subunit-like protein
MGQFMVLTGAVKNGLSWKGWNVDPFSTYDHNGPANITAGGFTFTNPTQWTVKLTIITAN